MSSLANVAEDIDCDGICNMSHTFALAVVP